MISFIDFEWYIKVSVILFMWSFYLEIVFLIHNGKPKNNLLLIVEFHIYRSFL